LIELNEAFAAQSLAVIQEAKLNTDIINVNGGAVALGAPAGRFRHLPVPKTDWRNATQKQ
jgi:hypothetical protein